MKKFMVLYMAPLAAMDRAMKASPKEMQEGMADWTKWADKHKAALVDLGAPLGRTKRVTSAGPQDARNELGGYSIVQGESADEVAKIFKGHPHLKMDKDAKIEIVEIVPMSM